MDSTQKHCRLESSATVGMAYLPPELILDILVRLPVKSLCRFRCVSRSWLCLIKHPRFVEMHRSRTQTQRLVFSADLIRRSLSSCTISFNCLDFQITPTGGADYNFVNMEIDYPFKKQKSGCFQILGSCNGFLCIMPEIDEFRCYVCNPSTKEYKRIPHFGRPRFKNHIRAVYGFGYAKFRSDDDYKLVRIDTNCNTIDLYSLRNDSWKSISNDFIRVYTIYGAIHRGVSLNGAIHWMFSTPDMETRHSGIAAFDLVEEKFKILPLPDSAARPYRFFMVKVMGGCLCLVPETGMFNEFWVMKDYGVKESWTKISLSFSFGLLHPLLVLKDSEDMLFYSNHRLLVLSNQKDGKVEQVRLDDGISSKFNQSLMWNEVYEETQESLASPNYNSGFKSEEKLLQYWFK